MSDRQIGVVENAFLNSDRKGEAATRFSRNPRPTEVFNDVRDDIKTQVSVGYRLLREVGRSEGAKDEPPTIRFAWEPREIRCLSSSPSALL